MIEKIKEIFVKKEGEPNKKKLENLVILLAILIVTIIAINYIWNEDENITQQEHSTDKNKKLATEIDSDLQVVNSSNTEDKMVEQLEEILSHINGVGKVKVMITYSRTSQTIPIYNEDSTEKNTEETDKQGGTRKVTETDTKKEIIYKEENGKKLPITQSIISPIIEGAIVTAQGAGNAIVKTNIIQAVEAVTGLATHKVQVFEMNNNP